MHYKARESIRNNSKRRQKCALLNNTKWRKIFNVLCTPDVRGNRILVSYIENGKKFAFGFLPEESDIADDHIRDPGLWGSGGPLYYDEIYELMIPFQDKDNHFFKDNFSKEEAISVFETLNGIGELPIELSDHCLSIKGYSNLSSLP